jgi:hypothetical protein
MKKLTLVMDWRGLLDSLLNACWQFTVSVGRSHGISDAR